MGKSTVGHFWFWLLVTALVVTVALLVWWYFGGGSDSVFTNLPAPVVDPWGG